MFKRGALEGHGCSRSTLLLSAVLESAPQDRIHVHYCKPGQKPVTGENTGLGLEAGEPFTVPGLNNIVKLAFKHLFIPTD